MPQPDSPLSNYLKQISQAVRHHDGAQLAQLTNPQFPAEWRASLAPELQSLQQAYSSGAVDDDPLPAVALRAGLPEDYLEFVVACLRFIAVKDSRDFYDSAGAILTAFCRPTFLYEQWQAPVLRTLCEGLIRLALDRDAFLSKKHGNRKTTAFNLQNRFSVVMSQILADKQNPSESRSSALIVANIALRFYVRIDEWQLCNKLLLQVERGRLDHAQYPKSQRVTYHFLIGRLKLFYHGFKLAEKHLAFALTHCHKDAIANRRRIFPLIVTTRLVRGLLPSAHLLQKYNVHEQFGPLIQAFRRGHFSAYYAALEAHAQYFASLGVYYILRHRTAALLYRNLFRTVSLITENTGSIKQIEYDSLLRAAQIAGATDIDANGIESVIALLIAHGYLKGYTLPARGKLILSKSTPFPHPYAVAQARGTSSASSVGKARPKPIRRVSSVQPGPSSVQGVAGSYFGGAAGGGGSLRRPSRRI
ncbi:hypothetical protein BDZ88DRAFT_483838 [Geranomyces variabilis]|nr:hypothetical protein BDZ88DRAFT_483838 [Geranomyces variabilis]KAJ3131910.1 PCI domain-containing protein 2 [Geranomyces variabilis]